jgi:cephalosporin-C deacetylase-like acetyl esterase
LHLETVYFNGEEFEGSTVRIFGHFGRPKTVEGKVPAVLHIHGGGQTATLDWPRFWAARGYACLSFDFCGDTNLPELGPGYRREHFTKWVNIPANMMKVSGGLSMSPSPRHNPWYHWMLACRRGLTFLESRPEVDADRLGIFGISVGGTLTWGVASVDSRVKAAVPIYGCGWEFYPYPPDTNAPAEENLRLWRALIAPETHAPRISFQFSS